MKSSLTLNLVLLTLSSLKYSLDELVEGKEDKKTLRRQIKVLQRTLLCALLVLNYESGDEESVRLITEFCLSPRFTPLTGAKTDKGFPITKTIWATSEQDELGAESSLKLSDLTCDFLLSMYRSFRPEVILA